MDEILKKMLESDLLSEETKAQISEQFKTAVEAFLAEERSKQEVEIRSTLTNEFVKARDELADTVNEMVEKFLTKEFDELHEEINKFRDLEVEYAEKLVEEKETLAQQLAEQLNQLVDNLDAFLEVRVDEELSELKEEIEDVRKLQFGRKIFEAVEAEFKKIRKEDLSSVESDLAEALDKLSDAENRLAEIENARLAEARETKLESLLAPLSGNAREQMKIILSNVKTEKLEESFKIYIGRILRESVDTKKEEPKENLTESKTEKEVTLFTGNEENLTEDVKPNDQILRMRKLAGLTATR